ncbi:copper chaperone PCu(A)C [Dietzia sp. CQ4]|jgi:hypothetical protein|nr:MULTISPECIES: copper chaperone PCu(A)C [unclassified Dietzia]MBB1034159.1 copper chaperone PCu(A)C [Dietzia sp. CQ4]MBB1052585.1 copper chaperone PCu(A)C [Dietzia sp. CW19]MDI6872165.1 copper chaperone PCu(A)C [Bacillota bacterium]
MRKSVLAAAVTAGTLLLSGCTTDSPGEPTTSSVPAESVAVVPEDVWVKAADTAGAATEHSGSEMNGQSQAMTSVFGTLRNQSDSDLRLVGVSSDASDRVELHETVQGPTGAATMRPREGGFVIPPGGALELAPGGDHIMLVGLRDRITTGQQVTLTLEFEDGSSTDMVVPGRSFEGGNEEYQGGE